MYEHITKSSGMYQLTGFIGIAEEEVPLSVSLFPQIILKIQKS